jgi:glutathione S-transferase
MDVPWGNLVAIHISKSRGGTEPEIQSSIELAEIAILLKELGLPYRIGRDWRNTTKELPAPTYKPLRDPRIWAPRTGRIAELGVMPEGYQGPAMWDPNYSNDPDDDEDDDGDGLKIFGVTDIILYLLEKYDTAQRLSFSPGSEYHYLALFSFVSTLMSTKVVLLADPYLNREVPLRNDPDALGHFETAVDDLTHCLEAILTGQQKMQQMIPGGAVGDGPWLIGNKMTFVDLLFGPCLYFVGCWMQHKSNETYPCCSLWLWNILRREGVLPAIKEATLPPPLEP